MDSEAAERIILAAAERLKSDLKEFGESIGERTIMFRLAHYMVAVSEGGKLRVDCEYNRHRHDPKTFPPKEEDLSHATGGKSTRFFPDIVIHSRTVDENNILVCEIKKKSDRRCYNIDHERLKKLTSPNGVFRYAVGVFLEVDQESIEINATYFKDGHIAGPTIKV